MWQVGGIGWEEIALADKNNELGGNGHLHFCKTKNPNNISICLVEGIFGITCKTMVVVVIPMELF